MGDCDNYRPHHIQVVISVESEWQWCKSWKVECLHKHLSSQNMSTRDTHTAKTAILLLIIFRMVVMGFIIITVSIGPTQCVILPTQSERMSARRVCYHRSGNLRASKVNGSKELEMPNGVCACLYVILWMYSVFIVCVSALSRMVRGQIKSVLSYSFCLRETAVLHSRPIRQADMHGTAQVATEINLSLQQIGWQWKAKLAKSHHEGDKNRK